MQEIIIRAGCFVAIIFLGYLLRKIEFFKEGDFYVLSKVSLKITLPAALVSSFAGKTIDSSMFLLPVIGLGTGMIYLLIMYLLNQKRGKDQQAFEMLNTTAYNIGNFTMPFIQSFLGPTGVVTASIFDCGNAAMTLGGAYGVASVVKGDGKFSVMRILKTLLKSVAFDCYMIMTILNLLKISLPGPMLSLIDIIAAANPFMAMLVIGVGFELSGNKSQIGTIIRILGVRYGVAIIFALIGYFTLPFSVGVRRTLVILFFSPIAAAAPAFTGDLKGDVGLSSAVNSVSIICSTVIIVTLLIFML